MVTTANSITVRKVLPKGVVTNYTAGSLSLDVLFNGVVTRYTCTTVVNSSLTVDGLLTFSAVNTTNAGGYKLKVVSESNADQDVNGVIVTPLGVGYIRKVTSVTTLDI